MTLRVIAPAPFVLHWTRDEWQQTRDQHATATSLGLHFVDLQALRGQQAPFRFTFFWVDENRWEGRDYATAVEAPQ